MARKAPKGRPARWPGWVYTLHLWPPYPDPPCPNGHKVTHYSGISRHGLKGRLTVHYGGGPDAARLLQVQKAAGGTFFLAKVEWGTQDMETARKYRGASRRCSYCKASPPAPGEPPPEMGWLCIVHLDSPRRRSASRSRPEGAQPAHCAVFIVDTESMYLALGRAGRDVAGVAELPKTHGGTWRLVSAEWAERTARLTERQAAHACPVCRAAKEQARADELLAAIQRGEVANRFDAKPRSWAARWHTRNGQPVVSDRPGGHLGHNVSRIAAALVRRGLVKPVPVPPPDPDEHADAGEQAQPADRPYQITRAGETALRRAGARRPTAQPRYLPASIRRELVRRLRADGLPITAQGRLWLSRMTDEQRDKAGVMTRAMARAHRELGEFHHPRRPERIRGLVPDDEWTTPVRQRAPMPARAAVTRQANGRSPRPVTDPSWPSTVGDGIQAAISSGDSPARPPARSRRAELTVTRCARPVTGGASQVSGARRAGRKTGSD